MAAAGLHRQPVEPGPPGLRKAPKKHKKPKHDQNGNFPGLPGPGSGNGNPNPYPTFSCDPPGVQDTTAGSQLKVG